MEIYMAIWRLKWGRDGVFGCCGLLLPSPQISHGGGGGDGFFFACESCGRMFDYSFPACALFLKWRLVCAR